ncbi:AlbA family DNA-binding domain-containing protein [Egbenema bharatensis]|uniref:AlbA family DNA-binding domain-containing protein n=1 Tax=Egbenema bharatensis TaxID=3463334 RepID=UPI003A8550D0
MLSEEQIIELIAKGENEAMDFKRELSLKSASEKSELIKDVISIANSKHDTGYLIIGIDDNGDIIGIGSIEEERIQQIIHSYINPSLEINCYLAFLSNNLLKVGVIEIRGSERPYKVSKSTDRLLQNDVFVRHGSVVAKASPEEIHQMYNQSRIPSERFGYVQAAEAFLKLNDFQRAIDSYSRAIDLFPTSDLFLLRANAHVSLSHALEKKRDHFFDSFSDLKEKENITLELEEINSSIVKQRDKALKDISDALLLGASLSIEKQARFERLKILANLAKDKDTEEWNEDLTWLKQHTKDKELGKVLLLEVRRIECKSDPFYYAPDEYAMSLLDEILRLGYDHVDVYIYRIDNRIGECNYGLALKESEAALSVTSEHDKILEVLWRRARALSSIAWVHPNRFNELLDLSEEIDKKYEKKEFEGWFAGIIGIEEEILCRCAMALEYGGLDKGELKRALRIAQFFRKSLSTFEGKNPRFASIIRKFLDHVTDTDEMERR